MLYSYRAKQPNPTYIHIYICEYLYMDKISCSQIINRHTNINDCKYLRNNGKNSIWKYTDLRKLFKEMKYWKHCRKCTSHIYIKWVTMCNHEYMKDEVHTNINPKQQYCMNVIFFQIDDKRRCGNINNTKRK